MEDKNEEKLCKGCGEEKDFEFWMPLEVVKGKEGEMRIGGVASDEHAKDLQNEKVFTSGLELDYLLERGCWNWNHSKNPDGILGEIDKASKEDGKLRVEGFLYPHVAQAQAVYNLMRSMKDSGSRRRLGLSIEGKIKERQGREVKKAWLKNIAITYNPINSGTYIDFVKSLGDFTFNKCTGNCGHCTLQETPPEVEKAQGSIIDPRVEVLATNPNTPDEQEIQLSTCPKCGKNHFGAGDICPEEPRANIDSVQTVNLGTLTTLDLGLNLGIEKSDKTIKEIIDFLAENPSPQDKDIHGLADRLGIAHDKFETTIYSVLGEIVKRGKGVDPDPKELEMGIEVEKEHTKYPELARFIALTHLKELPDYYTKLKAMEAKKALGAGYDIPATSGGVSGSAERTETLEKKPKVTTFDERHLGIKKLKKQDVKEMIKSSRGYSDEVSERLTDAIFMMVELQKAGPHKYIKREGMSGSYQYFYQMPKMGERLREPKESEWQHAKVAEGKPKRELFRVKLQDSEGRTSTQFVRAESEKQVRELMGKDRKVLSVQIEDHLPIPPTPTYQGGGRLIERVFEKAWPGAKSKGSLGHVLTILDKKGDKKVSRHHRIRNGNLELIEEHRRHLKGDGSFKKLLQNSVHKWISLKGKTQGHSFAKWLKENDLEAYNKLSRQLGVI